MNASSTFYRLFLLAFVVSVFSLTFYPPQPVHAIIAQENSTTCSQNGATTIDCTVTAPTDGNTLIAVIGVRNSTTGTVSSISQTGATWSQAAESVNGNDVVTEVWYANNVTSAGTTVTINLSGNYKGAAVIAEYSGLETSSVLDQTATNTGSGTSPDSGTTATTSSPDQLWVGGFANIDTATFSSPTNSFTEVGQAQSGGGPPQQRNNTGMYQRIVTSTGTANVGATLSGSQQWSGAIATFTGVPVPTQISFTTSARTITAGACSGSANVITFETQDSVGNPATPSSGTVVRVTSNSPEETIYSDDTCSTEVTSGDFTFNGSETSKSFYIVDTEKSNPTWTLTASQQSGAESMSDGTQSITVNAGAVSRLVVTMPGETFTDGSGNSGTPSNRTAGGSFNITSISATDDYFNVNTGYSGTKTLAYSGPGNAPDATSPTYTTSVDFTSGQSTTTLSTTLYNAETTTITVTDGGSYGYASSSFTVDPGAIDHYDVAASTPITAGTCSISGNSISAEDQWNNTRSTDASTVNMTTSGSGITFYTASDCSTPTTQYTMSSGTANFYYQTNDKQSGITITATKDADTPSGTSNSITVDPASASALLVRLPGQTFTDGSGISGSPSFSGTRSPNATAGTSFSVDIKAVDPYNNLVDSGSNNYDGSKTISWADSTAGTAPDGTAPSFPTSPVTFTNGEANSLSITYYNAATGRTVEIDDTATPVNGTASSTFTVEVDSATAYIVTPASANETAGVNFNVTITAVDSYENQLGSLYSAPSGTYTWSTTASSAPDGTSPSIGSLVQGDFSNGVATKSVTLYNAESGVTFTAGEPSASTVTGTSSSVAIGTGNVSADVNDSTVTGASTVDRDSPLTVTITLKDTWRNPVSGVPAGDIVASGTGAPSITQPASATDASGQTTADLTWTATGTQTVSIEIQNTTLVQNDGNTADADGFLDDTHDVEVSFPSGSSRFRGGTTIQGGSTIQ